MNVIIEENKSSNGVSVFYYKYTYENKRLKKLCPDCTSLKEAEMFLSTVLDKKNNQYLIKNIAEDMYIPGASQIQRLEAFGKHLDLKTIQQKRHIINQIVEQFGNKSIQKITVREVETFLLKDKHSASWKNLYLETFGSIFDETHWKCDKAVPRLPFKRFSQKPRKADVLAKEEISQVLQLNNFTCTRDYLFFLTMSLCGLRMGETRGLKVNQIDFKTNVIIINGFVKYNGERTCYNKKGSVDDTKIRVVPAPSSLLIVLVRWISDNHLELDDYLFADETGLPPTTDHMDWMFKKAIKNSGIQKGMRKIVPHSLRFTYVTRLRSAVPAETVQKIVGHSSLEMTEYYTRYNLEDLVEVVEPAREAINQVLVV